MKCPKCGYLGFDQVERCRNCGYEFSLAPVGSAPELPLKERKEEIGPLGDLSFLKEAETGAAAHSTGTDLPLFDTSPSTHDEPLITKASPPRQPLAVRRATPEVPRLRTEPRPQSLDLAFDSEPAVSSSPSVSYPRQSASSTPIGAGSRPDERLRAARAADWGPFDQKAPVGPEENAGLVARLIAVIIDVLILGIVDLLVVYFTMQISGVGFLEFGVLPKGPLVAFLIVQNGGYLVGFTAGGQTLGKMALGIRVVTADEAEPISVGRALRRTLLWTMLAIPAGLGFLTALLSPDHRGLHDRLAGTRVVRASA